MQRISDVSLNCGDNLTLNIRDRFGGFSSVPVSNAAGEVAITEVKFQFGKGSTGYYAVLFRKSQNYFFIKNGEKGRKIMDIMVQSGFSFKCDLPKRILEQAMQKFFAEKIRECTNSVVIPQLTGWHDGRYQHAGTCDIYRGFPLDNLMPLQEKELPAGTEEDVNMWLKQVDDLEVGKREKFLLVVSSLKGILTSILDECGIKYENLLYAVTENRECVRALCKLCQTFENGGEDIPCDLSMPPTKLEKELASVRDETLILTAFRSTDEYLKKKVLGNIEQVEGYFKGEKPLSSPYARWQESAAIVVCDFVPNTSAHKICLSSFDIKGAKMIGAVCKFLVHYVEEHFESVRGMLRNKYGTYRKITSSRNAADLAVAEIIQLFFKSFGLDFLDFLGISEFSQLIPLLDEEPFADNYLEEIKQLVCRRAGQVFIAGKGEKPLEGLEVKGLYFDENFLYIPAPLMNNWMEMEKLSWKRNEILQELKDANVLITGSEGYTRRKAVNGVEFETFKFGLDFFREVGTVDITKMGWRLCDVERQKREFY